jgi:hypothetical protein
MAFWITSHMRTKRKRVDDKLVVIKLFAVIMQEILYILSKINTRNKALSDIGNGKIKEIANPIPNVYEHPNQIVIFLN